MSRNHFVIKLLTAQLVELEKFISDSFHKKNLRARRRGQAVWHSHNGWTVTRISQKLGVSERIVWQWLKDYQTQGIKGLAGVRMFKSLER